MPIPRRPGDYGKRIQEGEEDIATAMVELGPGRSPIFAMAWRSSS